MGEFRSRVLDISRAQIKVGARLSGCSFVVGKAGARGSPQQALPATYFATSISRQSSSFCLRSANVPDDNQIWPAINLEPGYEDRGLQAQPGPAAMAFAKTR
jgi:hypothetical protein